MISVNGLGKTSERTEYLLAFGGDLPDTDDGVLYISCSDGKRPVVFKMERLDEKQSILLVFQVRPLVWGS